MPKLIFLFSTTALLLGCSVQTGSTRNFEKDKAEVIATLIKFWQAYERKDLTMMSGLLTTSSDFTFFGSDAAEVVKSRRDWEDLMQNDWLLFETTKFGEPRNLAIQVSDDGKLASAVYEVPDVSLVEGKSAHSLDRFAMTLRKEGETWRVVQGMTAVATVGQSSAEIVARRKGEAPPH